MRIPGAHIETLFSPTAYSFEQIERAVVIADRLQRGKLLLLECPPHDHGEQLDENGVCAFCARRADDD